MRPEDSLHIILKMGSIKEIFSTIESPTKVLVIGGCYGGLAAALDLLDLCHGKQARTIRFVKPDETILEQPITERPKLPIEIKIVDERDGYCNYARDQTFETR